MGAKKSSKKNVCIKKKPPARETGWERVTESQNSRHGKKGGICKTGSLFKKPKLLPVTFGIKKEANKGERKKKVIPKGGTTGAFGGGGKTEGRNVWVMEKNGPLIKKKKTRKGEPRKGPDSNQEAGATPIL